MNEANQKNWSETMDASDFTRFTVDAIPIAQPRHRIGVVRGRAMAYEAAKSHPIHVFKLAVREAAVAACRSEPPLDGPLMLEIEVVLPRPKSMMRKKDAPYASVLHDRCRPDCDNLAKGVMDAMQGIFWHDDGQVAKLYVSKWFAAGDELPYCRVMVGPASTGRMPKNR